MADFDDEPEEQVEAATLSDSTAEAVAQASLTGLTLEADPVTDAVVSVSRSVSDIVHNHEITGQLPESRPALQWLSRVAPYKASVYSVAVVFTAVLGAILSVPAGFSYFGALVLWICVFELDCLSCEPKRVELYEWFWSLLTVSWDLVTAKRTIAKVMLQRQFGIAGDSDENRNYDIWFEKNQQRVRLRLRSLVRLLSGFAIVMVLGFVVRRYSASCSEGESGNVAMGCYIGETCTDTGCFAKMQQIELTEVMTHQFSILFTEAHRAFGRTISTAVLVVICTCWKDVFHFIFADEPSRTQLFEKRLNISLNAITRDDTEDESRKFHMRTVNEMAIQDFLPGSYTRNVLEGAMNYAIDQQMHGADERARQQGRFLQAPRHVVEQINDQIINKLSSLFGSAFLQWDIAGASAIQQQEYIYAMTFDHDAKGCNRKFRLLLIKTDVFASLTSGEEPGSNMTTPGLSQIRSLTWEYCPIGGGRCKDGGCNCYGSTRIQDLMVLRRLLYKHHLWRDGTSGDGAVEKFNLGAWKRRGAKYGGPPIGTWDIREGDTVRHTEFDWVAQVEKHRYGHLFVKTSSNPQDELKKYVDKQQIDLEHPLAADDVRLQEPKCKESLRRWEKEDRIPIVGTVMVAVPEATSRQALARTFSRVLASQDGTPTSADSTPRNRRGVAVVVDPAANFVHVEPEPTIEPDNLTT